MAITLAEAAVKVVGDFNPLKQQASREAGAVGQTMGQKIGSGLKTALTAGGAIAGALAVPLLKMGDEVDAFNDTLRAGTGLVGDQLEQVQDVAKRVGSSVPEDLSQVSQVVADVQTRTGAMGEDLERLSGQILDYSRVTGTDAVQNTAELTRVFGDWGISIEDQAGSMDTLLRAQQATGVSASTLQQQLVKYGAPMRQLGFSFEETTALLGKFEKEGVNTELVMGSMRVALGKMARAGEEPVETLARVQEEIKGAGDAGEANALALELFGARAGPDMAAAIREGRFDITELMGSLEDGTNTVSGLADETADAGDTLKEFGNRVTLALGPMAEQFAGVSQAIGPMLYTLPLLGGALGKLVGGLGSLATSVGPKLLSGLMGLGPMVAGAGTAIGTAFTTAASAIIAAWPLVLAALVVAAIVLLVTNPELRAKALEVGGAIVGFIGEALGALAGVLGNVLGTIGTWVGQVVGVIGGIPGRVAEWVGQLIGQAGQIASGVVSTISTAVGNVVSFIIGIPGRAVGWVGSLISGAAQAAGGFIGKIAGMAGDVVSTLIGIPGRAIGAVIDGFANIGRQAVDSFLGFIRGIPEAVGNILGGVGDFIGGLIPSFDVGALEIPRDMLAMVHKGEMIVPAEEAEAIRQGTSALRGQGGAPVAPMGGGVTVNVYNPAPEPASTSVRRELQKRMVLGTV